jgi:hypothetical protein
MTSLGFRKDNDHIAERKKPATRPPVLPEPCTTPRRFPTLACGLGVPHGLLPTLVYSTFAFLLPILYFYMSYDYTSMSVRGLTIGASAVAGLLAIYSNSCCAWYNMALFFHTAIEVHVVDQTYRYAYAAGTSSTDMGLAIAGFVIVLCHLVPFFVTGRPMLLLLLAFAGVVVNTSLAVFVPALTSDLLLIAASALALLMVAQLVLGVCRVDPSLMCLLKDGLSSSGGLLSCQAYEL